METYLHQDKMWISVQQALLYDAKCVFKWLTQTVCIGFSLNSVWKEMFYFLIGKYFMPIFIWSIRWGKKHEYRISHWCTSWKFKIFVKNICKCFLSCLSPKWCISIKHLIEKNSWKIIKAVEWSIVPKKGYALKILQLLDMELPRAHQSTELVWPAPVIISCKELQKQMHCY